MPTGEVQQPGYSNYYIGSNPAKWRSRVPSFAVARYTDLYTGEKRVRKIITLKPYAFLWALIKNK